MKKPTKPTPDEMARAAAVRLQIATGWYVAASGGRIILRLTPAQTDSFIDIINDKKRLIEQQIIDSSGGDTA